MVASGLPVAGLDAERPRARLAIAAPLSNGIPGEAELIDTWLVDRVPRWRAREALEACLPDGYALTDIYDVWLGEPPLPGRVAASVYRAEVMTAQADRLGAAAATLLDARALPRERRKGEGTVDYDLRPFLASIEVSPPAGDRATVRMTLLHDPARGVGRPDEALAALGEAVGGTPLQVERLVRERLVLADSTPSTPAPREPARRPPPAAPAARRPPRNAMSGGR